MEQLKKFRVTSKSLVGKVPFADFYKATTKDEALLMAYEDGNRYGLPSDAVYECEEINRFVLNMGAIYQLFPDLPEQPADGSIVLWDRQEKKPVVTLHGAYAQAICLELDQPGAQPISELETWFNSLDNDALESEGITPTV